MQPSDELFQLIRSALPEYVCEDEHSIDLSLSKSLWLQIDIQVDTALDQILIISHSYIEGMYKLIDSDSCNTNMTKAAVPLNKMASA